MNGHQAIRSCGFAGIVGAALLLASDWLMLGHWTSGRELAENWLELLADTAKWRVIVGAAVGPLGAWLYVIGFWQIYLALRPAGHWLAFFCWAGFSVAFIYVAAAFHASFPFIADAAQSMDSAGTDAGNAPPGAVFEYAGLLFAISVLPALLGCLIMAYAVLALPTRYPRWMVVFNPALLYAVTLTFRYIPAPLGGPLCIGFGNIIFLMFFVASTMVLRNGGREHGDRGTRLVE